MDLIDFSEWPKSLKASDSAIPVHQTSFTTAGTQQSERLYFSGQVINEHNLQIVAQEEVCKFSQKPKYEIRFASPNDMDLREVYSVPCGAVACDNWLLIDLSLAPTWGPGRIAWVKKYMKSVNWMEIIEAKSRKFCCPACKQENAAA